MTAPGATPDPAGGDLPAAAGDPEARVGPVPASAPPFEVGVLDSQGLQLYYEIHGNGPRTLVFLHAILMDSDMNRRLATDLAAAGNRVILLDLPGHGRSDKPARASYHRMDTYAEHVVALLDHLGIDECFGYGVFTEYCVQCALTGLLKSGRRVSLVTEATAHLSDADGERVVNNFVESGGRRVTLADALR